jgi:hypothetical protein
MSISPSTAAASRNARQRPLWGPARQRPLWGQVQVSPASFVAELNAVVGVALEAADDDDAISVTIFWTLVYKHGA